MSVVSRDIGTPLIPAKLLNSAAFPSITGILASAPIFPKPRTAVPSVTTATVFPLIVYSYTFLESSWISLQGSATPGEYAKLNCCLFVTLTFGVISSLPWFSLCISKASSLKDI